MTRPFFCSVCKIFPLAIIALSMAQPPMLQADTVTLGFDSDTQGFVNSGAAGGAVSFSSAIGGGSLHLTNPSGWVWRGQLDFGSGSSGVLHDLYAAIAQSGLNGGTLRFDLILTNPGVAGIGTGFSGVSYLVGFNQDPANGGGWDQVVAASVPAGSFPIGSTTTIPVQITLVQTTNTPVNGNDSVLSLRSDSSWYQIQLGNTANNVSSVEWYIDNLSVQPNTPAPPPPATNGAITLEAENGILVGNVYITTSTPGYSGSGYVSGFQTSTDVVQWNFTGTNGLYDLTIRFHSPSGPKGFDGLVNGFGFSGTFPQTNVFADFDAGLVELVAGANTLQIGGGWDYYDIDRVVLTPTNAPPPPLPVPATLSDPLATFAARCLMASLVADYGKHTWAGQHDASEIAFIQSTTGRRPVIVEGDFMDYSPSRVYYQGMPANYTESMIPLEGSAGHVLSFCWHWNAPTNLINTVGSEWWRGFYTFATTFDVAAALADTNSVEYSLILRDIDAIAVQLQKVASNNIPVLWRPLHEAEGGWFWWGAKGPDAFKALWRLLYSRLTTVHGLHNLIWVLASSDPNWYPGDDVVDVVGLDGYPDNLSDALYPQWQDLKTRLDGRKLITLSEFGGVPDIERMQRLGVWWSWFSPWGSSPSSTPTNTVIRIYQSPTVITLDEFNAVPPQFTPMPLFAGNSFSLSGTGPRGAAYRLQASSDLAVPLANWITLTNSTFTGGVFTFIDPAINLFPRRFYRVTVP